MVNPVQDCSDMGAIYEITCTTCKEPVKEGGEGPECSRDPGGQPRYNYIGMTSTSVHCRMLGHLEGQKAKSGSNPLYRHDLDVHNGETIGLLNKDSKERTDTTPLEPNGSSLHIKAKFRDFPQWQRRRRQRSDCSVARHKGMTLGQN